jgi:phosphosulfolactate synthase
MRTGKLRVIERLAAESTVLSEVGSKSEDVIFAPNRWVHMIQRELEAGSWKVITEGANPAPSGCTMPTGRSKKV